MRGVSSVHERFFGSMSMFFDFSFGSVLNLAMVWAPLVPLLPHQRWKSSTSSKSSSSSSISPLVAIVGGAALTSILAFCRTGRRAGRQMRFWEMGVLRLWIRTAHRITVTALKYGFGPINESTKTDVLWVNCGKNVRNCVGGCRFEAR